MTRIKISLVLRACKDVRKSAAHHLSRREWEQWVERNWSFIVRGIKASPIANQVVKIIFWSVIWVDAVLNQWNQYHSTKTGSREHKLKQQYLEQKDKLHGGVCTVRGYRGFWMRKWTYGAQPAVTLNDGASGKQNSRGTRGKKWDNCGMLLAGTGEENSSDGPEA